MERVSEHGRLTKRETAFCGHYHRLRDVREAAALAGLTPEQGEALLRTGRVRETLREWDEAACDPGRLRGDVIAGLKRLAFGTAADSVRWVQEEAPDWEKVDLFRVSEIKRRQNDTLEVRFFDRFRAMEMLLELAESERSGDGAARLYQALERSIPTGEEPPDED